MLTTKQLRRMRTFLRPRHDPLSSWRMWSKDAPNNPGRLPPVEFRRHLTSVLADVFAESGEEFMIAGCWIMAAVAAYVATRQTGTLYRIESGMHTRVVGVNGNVVDHYSQDGVAPKPGSGEKAIFHTWVVAAHPGRRIEYFDPQAMFWEQYGGMVWDWDTQIFQDGIAWTARPIATRRAIEKAADAQDVVVALARRTMERLSPAVVPSG